MRTVGFILLVLAVGETYLYRWLAHRRESELFDRFADATVQPRSLVAAEHASVTGLLETVGRWDGFAEASEEGLVVIGEHTWWESSQEFREQEQFAVAWEQIESASVSDQGLELKPRSPSMILRIKVSDFGEGGSEGWVARLQEKGIQVHHAFPSDEALD